MTGIPVTQTLGLLPHFLQSTEWQRLALTTLLVIPQHASCHVPQPFTQLPPFYIVLNSQYILCFCIIHFAVSPLNESFGGTQFCFLKTTVAISAAEKPFKSDTQWPQVVSHTKDGWVIVNMYYCNKSCFNYKRIIHYSPTQQLKRKNLLSI